MIRLLPLLFLTTIGFAEEPYRIAFGSCAHQEHPLPILNLVVEHKADVFVFLGDNLYGDTDDMSVLRSKYERLTEKPSYRNLAANTRILATWDDHDYGRNDAGKEYAHKEASKEIFLEFFGEPEDSSRRDHSGIYHAEYIEVAGKTVQILLLDNRTFRDPVLRADSDTQKNKDSRFFYRLDYQPHPQPGPTLLGAAQWKWLEGELRKSADVRIIASGSQFGIEYNGYEAWANFPHEQQRMIDLIRETRAEGVIFLTGDVHYAEISRLEPEGGYPLYDLTASGLSSTWKFATPNANRIEGPIMDNHFGMLSLFLEASEPYLQAEVWDIRNNQRIEHTIPLSELEFVDEEIDQ